MQWGSVSQALQRWRDAVEERGVFVFKRSFQQGVICGFSLAHPEFPIIYLNNSSSDSRQIFTLFHELAHLLYAVSGVTVAGDRPFTELTDPDRDIEMVCNRFAAALLVPDEDFERRAVRVTASDSQIAGLARIYSVSREVILRKLLDRGVVTRDYYEQKAEQWNSEFLNRREQSEGGNYYATQAAYLGRHFLRLAFGSYRAGRISLPELVDHVGVRAKNIPKFEAFFTGDL